MLSYKLFVLFYVRNPLRHAIRLQPLLIHELISYLHRPLPCIMRHHTLMPLLYVRKSI